MLNFFTIIRLQNNVFFWQLDIINLGASCSLRCRLFLQGQLSRMDAMTFQGEEMMRSDYSKDE